MTDTVRELIIAGICTSLANVRTENGYSTECGSTVFRAVKNPTSTPCFVVWPGVEEYEPFYDVTKCTMPVEVEGIMDFSGSTASVISEKILGDLHKIVFSTSFGGTKKFNLNVKSGGVDEYPTSDRELSGSKITLEIKYEIKTGDPFTQPA